MGNPFALHSVRVQLIHKATRLKTNAGRGVRFNFILNVIRLAMSKQHDGFLHKLDVDI